MNQQTIHNKLLSTKRPHGSATNTRITAWLKTQLPFDLQKTAFTDGAGNLHIDNRTTDKHRTLFVAHVDTVHRNEGKNKIAKTKTHWYAKGDVLGADDGAGVALLMHLLYNNVPGYYILTQGEERGGIGARYLREKQEKLLRQFDRAIAFDRRGIDSVITHQGWGRCCSDAFGLALCDALMDGSEHLMMLNDDTGIYTDTAEFVDIIPECTNISVGYDKEHTQQESLNLIHYQHLSSAAIALDWDSLPVARDPHEPEPDTHGYGPGSWWQEYKTHSAYSYKNYSSYTSPFDDDDFIYSDSRIREEVIDAVIDAQYGYTLALADLIAESVYPEDKDLVIKHLNFKQLDPRCLDEALEAIEAGEDIDLVLASLFDEVHVA